MPSLLPTATLALWLLALAAGLTTRRASLRWLLLGASAFVVLVWLPILAAALLDPEGAIVGNAIGLGLLAWGGSLLGGAALVLGLGARALEIVLGSVRAARR